MDCSMCGEEIPPPRLEAIPITLTCNADLRPRTCPLASASGGPAPVRAPEGSTGRRTSGGRRQAAHDLAMRTTRGYAAGKDDAHAEFAGHGSSATMRRRASASSARLCGPSLSTPCWRPRRPSCFRTITSRDAPGRAGSPVGAGATRRHIEPTPAAGPRSRPDTSTAATVCSWPRCALRGPGARAWPWPRHTRSRDREDRGPTHRGESRVTATSPSLLP